LFQRLVRRVQREADGAEGDSFQPVRRGRKLGSADADPVDVPLQPGERQGHRPWPMTIISGCTVSAIAAVDGGRRAERLLPAQFLGGRVEQTDLARGAAEAAVHPAAEDQARADPLVDQQIDEVVDVLGHAMSAFGQCGGVGVVVHDDPARERLREPFGQRNAVPARNRTFSSSVWGGSLHTSYRQPRASSTTCFVKVKVKVFAGLAARRSATASWSLARSTRLVGTCTRWRARIRSRHAPSSPRASAGRLRLSASS
jgi:hypothetical protein